MRTRTLFTVALPLVAIGLVWGAARAGSGEQDKTVRLAYVKWSSSVASANLVKAVFEKKMGLRCRLVEMQADEMWHAVAEGKVDAMLSAWLPDTHAHYRQQVVDKVDDLGPNLEGTRTGLVVPDVTEGRFTTGTGVRNRPTIKVQSMTELAEFAAEFNHRIVGIDAEAGVMHKTRQAMEVYGLDGFRLIEGSEEAMTKELSEAIRRHKWLVVTGWRPHWSFARWKLRFLKDPENVFGGEGRIHTIARQGLEEDMPRAHAFLDAFHWSPEEMGQLMLWNRAEDGLYPYDQALRWMRTHPAKVASWLHAAGQKGG